MATDNAAVMRLERLEAKADLNALVQRYVTTADRRQWREWSQCFTENAQFDLPNSFGLMKGRQEIYDICVGKMDHAWADTQHNVVSRDFKVDGDTATGSANIFFSGLPVGADPTQSYAMGGRYRWQFTRNPAGEWAIADAWEEFIWNNGSEQQAVFAQDTDDVPSSTEATAREFMKRLADQNFMGAFEMLSEDGTYTVIGTTPVSRTYYGRRDLLENLVPVLGDFREAPALSFQDPIIAGDRAVILGGGSGIGPTGPYDQPYYAFVTRIAGGEFKDIIEFMDTGMLTTAVFGSGPADSSHEQEAGKHDERQ
ncbi:nuclear transport factor 2 family protein [Sphingobium phenoxybenzoativorans]|uniref:Nuclear transport factor 2 family protein n=1 Tax=Sphingobium phenoxybenzoativorans TaxID=1592790 RepID=A0A975Q2L8_9SPHN|nr:nuclear transport factor 2 family protein [Sphingobium phenoxybenzoativorans]QUT06821.1 nuclear transport factor 2 family protein [Sphingobium phenoxybenzoativorans]